MIRELESAGHTALAPPNPLRGVAFDASVVTGVVKAIEGPVVLVGHSYGGAMITQASAGLENVTGLVFLAAFGLEVGESCATVQQPFPPPLLAQTVAPTPYDAPGAAGGPDLYVKKDQFRETFCADVPVDMSDVMFATQRRSRSRRSTRTPLPRLEEQPSWFLVSERDNAISPDANGSWRSGWALPPTPLTARTPLHREAGRRGYVHPAGAAVTSDTRIGQRAGQKLGAMALRNRSRFAVDMDEVFSHGYHLVPDWSPRRRTTTRRRNSAPLSSTS